MALQKRIVVFIDNSNVYRRLFDINKTGQKWPIKYDPLFLSRKLAGNRELVGVKFYCSPPPAHLQNDGENSEKKYWAQIGYYEAIKKLDLVEFKQGFLTGGKGNLTEKNLDTQIVTDLMAGAYKDTYDTAIICSNDGDFQSAILAVREMGKRVEVSYFKGSASYALMKSCDLTRRSRKSYYAWLDCGCEPKTAEEDSDNSQN